MFVEIPQSLDHFTYVVVLRSAAVLSPIFTFLAIERIGRRPFYLTMGLLSFASLYTGMIAIFILFGLFYAGGFGAIGPVISA